MNQSGHDARTGHTEWVTKSDRSTVDIQFVHGNSEMLR